MFPKFPFWKLLNANSFPSLESQTLPPGGFSLPVYLSFSPNFPLLEKAMDKRRRKQAKTSSCYSEGEFSPFIFSTKSLSGSFFFFFFFFKVFFPSKN